MKHLTILLLAIFLMVAFSATGYSQTTTIKKDGNTTVFLDKSGNRTGSATKSGNTIIFRDSHNKITAPARSSRNMTTAHKSNRKLIVKVAKPKE
jgi:hypothetical protein